MDFYQGPLAPHNDAMTSRGCFDCCSVAGDVLHWRHDVAQWHKSQISGVRKMKKLTIRETRQSLSHLDRLLSGVGEVTITRRGEAIARLTPIHKKRSIPSHQDLRESMPRMRKGSEKLVREDRDTR
jgi:antitoxin (DNA-binding transcriptional repressor) of toxin-antitoxin stability system